MPGPIASPGSRSGSDDKTYRHQQSVPSTHWIANHGLNKPVSVTLSTFGNVPFLAGWEYDSIDPNNIVHIYPGIAMTGYADFN